MRFVAEPIARLIEEFNKLPGIGPKSAQRLTYHLLRNSDEEARALAEAIIMLKEKIKLCSLCFNNTDGDTMVFIMCFTELSILRRVSGLKS
jgi:recombination protein RecR